MKLGVITYAFYPRMSGVAHVVKSIYSTLLKNHSDIEKIDVLAYNDGGLKEIEDFDGLTVYRFTTPTLLGGRIPLIGWDFISKAWAFIDKKNIDQVHIHTRFSTTSFFCLLIAKIKGIKVYHYEHLGDYIRGEGFLINTASYIWDMVISRFLFTFSDKIIAVSNSIHTFLHTEFGVPENKIVVIENGCDYTAETTTFTQKFAHKTQFNLLFASRLVSLKNPLMTLEAVHHLIQNGITRIHFDICGAGKLEDEIISYINKYNLHEFVTFHGKLESKQMQDMLLKNDIIINCSLLEGFPGIVIEGVFKNNFVVTTNVCGNKDIIYKDELLLDISTLTPQTIADKIKECITHKTEIAHKMDEIKSHFVQNNTWDIISEKLYTEIISA